MGCPDTEKCLNQLSAFRTELADLAYVMDRRGRAEAADVALMAFARIGEICEELRPGENARSHPPTSTVERDLRAR